MIALHAILTLAPLTNCKHPFAGAAAALAGGMRMDASRAEATSRDLTIAPLMMPARILPAAAKRQRGRAP